MVDTIEDKIINKMKKCGRGSVFFISDFVAYGNRNAINKALERLTEKGLILRAARGIYCYPKIEKVYGLGPIPPSMEDIAEAMAPHIKAAGAVFVDNSSAFRLYDDVPLVVPEINPEDVEWNNGIISNPNCTTIISLVAINAINKLSKIEGIYASSYQATSFATRSWNAA